MMIFNRVDLGKYYDVFKLDNFEIILLDYIFEKNDVTYRINTEGNIQDLFKIKIKDNTFSSIIIKIDEFLKIGFNDVRNSGDIIISREIVSVYVDKELNVFQGTIV